MAAASCLHDSRICRHEPHNGLTPHRVDAGQPHLPRRIGAAGIVFNEFLRIVDSMGTALQILLGFVGTLTLAIGGIGLANIMLVSVTQRAREIGMLKSIGATSRSILFQFLLEAMAIVLDLIWQWLRLLDFTS